MNKPKNVSALEMRHYLEKYFPKNTEWTSERRESFIRGFKYGYLIRGSELNKKKKK